jgi:hypothetical protein
MSTDTKVWASLAMLNSGVQLNAIIMPEDKDQADYAPAESERLIQISTNYGRSIIDNSSELPRKFCGRYKDTKVKKLSHLFTIAGFVMMSERCASVFQSFDLGVGGVYPVEIHHGDRRTLVTPDTIYILNFGSKKPVFRPDKSSLSSLKKIGGHECYIPYEIADGDFALSADALDGPDLWIDPGLINVFFLSCRLIQALQVAKVIQNIDPKSCRIISNTPG